jgi:hypothetical protein
VINKKNLLGKTPEELGDKDAIHVAIVAVRAAYLIAPGTRCGMNANKECVPDPNGPGIADPWHKGNIMRGEVFWLLLNQTEVPNVQHVWTHPTVDFSPPSTPVRLNGTLDNAAQELNCTYEQLMEACQYVIDNNKAAPYNGTNVAALASVMKAIEDNYELSEIWSAWSDETGYEFDNSGSSCCPEYDYPEVLFRY